MRNLKLASALIGVLLGLSTSVAPARADDKLYPFLGVPQVAKAQTPVDPVNLPKGSSATPLRLAADSWYVVDCKVDCIVYGSQIGTGRIKIVAESGPIRLRGKFSDGGTVETRKFDGPFVYVVEAASTGPCELSVIPKGVKEEGEIFRRLIDVALNPIPPPEPKPPGPTPPAPGPDAGLRVLIEFESADTLSSDQHNAIYSSEVRDYLNSHCIKSGNRAEWNIWDRDAKGIETMPQTWQTMHADIKGKPMPWILAVRGEKRISQAVPKTKAEMLKLLKEIGGP